MKKVSLYLLSILLLSNIAAYNQIQEHPSNYYDGGRVYVNKWIEVPLGYDQWGHPTPDTRKLLITVIGPDIIEQGTIGTFIIEISPEHFSLPLSDPESEYISSANISLITDGGSFEFGPNPRYKAIYGNNGTLEYLTDISDSWRNFYITSASILQSIASVVPYLGQSLAATQAASSLLAWKKGSEPDWEEVWNNEFEKDIYPLPNPRHIVQQGFVRKYVYEVPFTYLTGQGDLFLQIDLVVIKHQYSDDGSFIYNFAFPLIQNKVTKKEVVPIFDKHNGNHSLSIDGLGILNFDYSINIGLTGNNMTIKVSPENMSTQFHFTKIELALQAKKGTVKLRGMPAILDNHNNVLNFQSYKNIAGRIALRDMVNFGVSVYFFNTNTGTAISGTQALFTASEGIGNAFNNVSFSSSIDMQWKQQNNFDVFFMPQVKKDLRGKNIQDFNINFPLDFYTENILNSMQLNGFFYY